MNSQLNCMNIQFCNANEQLLLKLEID